MHRIGLAAHNGLAGQPEAVDGATALGDVPRQRHWDRREAPQALADHGIQKWEPVKGRVWVQSHLVGQFALEHERARLRQLPHEEAQPVACGVDARGHVVETFCRFINVVEVARLFVEATQESERSRAASLAGFQHVVICQGGFTGLREKIQYP